MKTLGILGGMGPYATMMFYEQILKETKANKDWEYIPCIIDIATDIPSRTLVAQGKESETELIVRSSEHIRRIVGSSDIICAPCNSFHYFKNKICNYLMNQYWSIDWPDIIEITSKEVLSKGYTHPLILGGWIVNNKREDMYGKYFPDAVYLNQVWQNHIIKIIELIKTNKDYSIELNQLLTYLYYSNTFDSVILGCTELIQIQEPLYIIRPYISVFDSSSIYAREIVKLCKET
jgi:aspartate racemase